MYLIKNIILVSTCFLMFSSGAEAQKKKTTTKKIAPIKKVETVKKTAPIKKTSPTSPPVAPTPPAAPPTPVVENSTKVINETPRVKNHIGLGYASWREPLDIDSITDVNGTASFSGPTLSYLIRKKTDETLWGYGFGFFSGGADARSDDLTTYRANRVSALGAYASIHYTILRQENLRLNIGTDLLSKFIEWPTLGGVDTVLTSPLNLGPNITIEYDFFKNLSIFQRVGTYSKAGDVFWGFGLIFDL